MLPDMSETMNVCSSIFENASAPSEVFLIRHGRTAWNDQNRYQGHIDVPLDKVGRQMAEAWANRLASEQVDAVYSSDLLRARQTAEPLARVLGLELILDWRLRESRLRRHEPNPPYPVLSFVKEVETPEDVLERARLSMEEIARRNSGRRVAVFSHGGISRRFINSLPPPRSNPPVPYLNINAAINHLRWEQGGWQVVRLNDASHLQEAGLVTSKQDAG
jgi:broad specificity phosphatase PhoE